MHPKGVDNKPAPHSRAEQIARDDGEINLPDAPAHLLTWLGQLGWFEHGAAGVIPLSAQEIKAWADGTRHQPEGWEFEALLAASRAYVNEYHADKPNPPDQAAVERPSVAGRFKGIAQQLNGKP